MGNFIIIHLNNGYKTMYAHLDKILAQEGDYVEKYQLVALSGNTGLSTGPHLHYTLWKDDVLVDPIYYVSDFPHTEGFINEYVSRGDNIDEIFR